ncbi:hypothetical protein, partial [Brevundimonas aurantiaca]|uniref:hypothetical protein n=1 Tax=Brevundimonas aurantiaca TaxID=74316 RepID=UPI001748C6D9
SGLLLAQHAYDLRFVEPALLHVRLLDETDSHSKRGIRKGAPQLNLTDEENRQNHGDLGGSRDSTYVYHHTGRQIYIGARYRF